MYVGGEVAVGSLIVNFLGLPKMGGLSHETASHFLAFYWGGLMIGPMVVPKELNDWERLRRLGAVRSGPRMVT